MHWRVAAASAVRHRGAGRPTGGRCRPRIHERQMEEVSMESNDSRIREFVDSNFPPVSADAAYSDTQSLLEAGAIDSMGVLVLVTWLEQEFGFVVDDEDVVPENLDSIASITAYVERKLAEPGLA